MRENLLGFGLSPRIRFNCVLVLKCIYLVNKLPVIHNLEKES